MGKNMKKINISILMFIAMPVVVAFSIIANAATVEIEWFEPEKYTDIRHGNYHKKNFQENIFKQLEKHVSKLSSKKLPEHQILKLSVTNVDLAGDVRFGNIDRVRIVKHHFPPRLTFSYQLIDAKKQTLKTGEENLSDLSFMQGATRYHSDYLKYEKILLDKWFRKTFTKIPKSTNGV
jgi:hypothetical protein